MAIAIKPLGQINPSATTLTTLYVVPLLTTAVVSSIVVCNISNTASTFRLAIRYGGASLTNAQYLYYDLEITGNNTFAPILGITLAASDVVSVYSSSNNLVFNIFGQENS